MATTGWVFLFACVAAYCQGGRAPTAGDGVYYETRTQCEHAARVQFYGHWSPQWQVGREIVCVERDRPR